MISAIIRIASLVFVMNLIVCHIREERWTRDASFSNKGVWTTQGTNVTTRSRIECSIECTSVDGCRSFNFDSTSGICNLSPNEPEWVSSNSIDKIGCPTEKGYTSFTHDTISMSVCLKLDTTYRNRASAELACQEDGGHLVMFTSKDMHTWVAALLNAGISGNPPPDDVWFDGERHDNGDIVYSSHTGEVASWYEWKDTDDDEFYVKGEREEGYLFGVDEPDDAHPSLCQIDMY